MTNLISIGNSQGIRIPKSIIQQAGLEDVELELKVVPEGVLIKPVHSVRQGWAEACALMHKSKEDILLLEEVENNFDKDEWQW